MSNMKICFVGRLSSSFIKGDYEVLKKHFNVDFAEPPSTKLELIKYPFITKKKVRKCDVVFCWFAGLQSAVAVYYAKRYNRKSIVVAGGYDAAYVPEINYGAFTNIKERIPAKYVLKNANIVLPVSNFTKNEILEKVKPRGKTIIVYNGVDDKKFIYLPNKKENIVITVGAINKNNLKRKGTETFIKTASLLPDIHFVVIGKFKDNSIDYLMSIATHNVEFTGFIPDKELLKWYQKAKVVCQLSYYEAFGLAPAEAMACGCIPVVTKERAGLPEFVGETGFYVPYGDEKATAEAIKKALNTPDELGEKARERIKKNFSMKKRENKLIKTIKG